MKWKLAELRTDLALLWAGITILAAIIFAIDTMTDLEIAVAVLYVSVILMSARLGSPKVVILVGAASAVLTVLSYLLTPRGDPEAGLANCGLGIGAIAVTTYLTAKMTAAEIAAKQVQADLAHMSRVTTMGELTASIAHEVRQPLAAISANANGAIRWLTGPTFDQNEAMRALQRIVSDAERAGEVIARVRQLVARTPAPRDRIDMGHLILETVGLIDAEIRKNRIALRTSIAEDLPPILGDRVQLQQVILNFVINAIEAMAKQEADNRSLLVSAAADGKRITLSVRDSGIGVPPAALDRIFEAFYTTKLGGLGMGLAVSRSIVEAHGGTVYAAPNLPRGMVFGVILPLELHSES